MTKAHTDPCSSHACLSDRRRRGRAYARIRTAKDAQEDLAVGQGGQLVAAWAQLVGRQPQRQLPPHEEHPQMRPEKLVVFVFMRRWSEHVWLVACSCARARVRARERGRAGRCCRAPGPTCPFALSFLVASCACALSLVRSRSRSRSRSLARARTRALWLVCWD